MNNTITSLTIALWLQRYHSEMFVFRVFSDMIIMKIMLRHNFKPQ